MGSPLPFPTSMDRLTDGQTRLKTLPSPTPLASGKNWPARMHNIGTDDLQFDDALKKQMQMTTV